MAHGRARTALFQRTQQALTTEMGRLKAARGTVGGKIEGISAVRTGGTGLLATLKGLLGMGGPASKARTQDVGADEAEELVWGDKGAFRWEDIEGVEVEWAVSGGLGPRTTQTTGETEQGSQDELDDVREWLDSL